MEACLVYLVGAAPFRACDFFDFRSSGPYCYEIRKKHIKYPYQ